jgi:outer membrane lipoprotein-sorting protein
VGGRARRQSLAVASLRPFLAVLIALGLAAPAFAQVHGPVLTDAQEAVLVQVGDYLNSIRTLKARFLQTAPDGKTERGTAWLERPGHMRFAYDPPSPLLLVAGHGTVIFHDAKLGQTTNIPLDQTPLGLLLRDKISLSGDVTLTDFQRPPGQIQLTLVRTKSPGDGSLTLYLEAGPLALTGWTVIDAQGQQTTIRLTDISTGGSFDPSLFTFVDPDSDKP